MSGPIATEYAAQVAEAMRPSVTPLRSPDEAARRAGRDERRPRRRRRRRPSSAAGRARSSPNARETSATKIGSVPKRSATVDAVVRSDRVGERDLVQEDPEHRRDDEQQDVAALDAERVLTREREAGEDRRAEREAHRRVGERLPSVRQGVLDDREVEAPEQDRDEEQDVRRDAVAHGARTLAVSLRATAGV